MFAVQHGETLGPIALGNEVQTIRSIFRYGLESGLLEKPVRIGPAFSGPSTKALRLKRSTENVIHLFCPGS